MDTVLKLLNDTSKCLELKENISKLANTSADKKIADEILNYINEAN
jgi:UDP-N-acetylglucosamine:LPS N-acetylglucosamine transferase